MHHHRLIVLSDVLDSFKADTKPKRPAPPPPTNPSGSSATVNAPGGPRLEEDPADLFGPEFAAQLQAGMEELLNELGHGPPEGEDPKEFAAMREAWEKMLISGMDAQGTVPTGVDPSGIFSTSAAPPSVPAPKPASSSSSKAPPVAGPSTSKPTGSKDEDFQKTIRQAMDKLKESDETLKVCVAFIHSWDRTYSV